jgi:hypothetical protein
MPIGKYDSMRVWERPTAGSPLLCDRSGERIDRGQSYYVAKPPLGKFEKVCERCYQLVGKTA